MTDPIIEETKEIMRENAAGFAEIRRMNRETSESMKDTDRRIKELSKHIGGIENNEGKIVEEYFSNTLNDNLEVNGIKYDSLHTNLNGKVNGMSDEFDIVLINGETVLIIEVKKVARKKHIQKIKKKLESFPRMFKAYKNMEIKGALASFQMDDNIRKEIVDNNLIAMQRKGKIIVTSA